MRKNKFWRGQKSEHPTQLRLIVLTQLFFLKGNWLFCRDEKHQTEYWSMRGCLNPIIFQETPTLVETSCPSTGGPWKICNKRLQVTSAAHLDAIAWSLERRKLIRYHRVGFTDGIWCGNIFLGGRTWLSNALLPWCVCLLFVVLFCFSCVVCSVFYVEKTANNKYVDVISQNDFVGCCCCMKWWTAGYTRCYFSKCM